MSVKGEPFLRANRDLKCPVCGRPDWCMVAPSGEAALCQRVESGDRRGDGGWLHKLRPETPVTTRPARPREQEAGGTDWLAEARRFAAELTPDGKARLAASLGLPAGGLDCFPLVGRGGPQGERFFTFPEVDGAGRVVGIGTRRRADKAFLPAGKRGLSVPAGFDAARCAALFVVEGPTDVAAMRCAGLWAVGRPSNCGGAGMLVCLLKSCPDACRIVVVGENDAKENGDWPGLTGACSVAGTLSNGLDRKPPHKRVPVAWAMTPDGAKDVRAWLTARTEPWAERGRALARTLLAEAVAETDATTRRLWVENRELKRQMAEIREQMRKLTGG